MSHWHIYFPNIIVYMTQSWFMSQHNEIITVIPYPVKCASSPLNVSPFCVERWWVTLSEECGPARNKLGSVKHLHHYKYPKPQITCATSPQQRWDNEERLRRVRNKSSTTEYVIIYHHVIIYRDVNNQVGICCSPTFLHIFWKMSYWISFLGFETVEFGFNHSSTLPQSWTEELLCVLMNSSADKARSLFSSWKRLTRWSRSLHWNGPLSMPCSRGIINRRGGGHYYESSSVQLLKCCIWSATAIWEDFLTFSSFSLLLRRIQLFIK